MKIKSFLQISKISKDYTLSGNSILKNIMTLGSERKQSELAVDDVSFSLKQGEILGMVGESGCGKSTLGKIISGVLDQTKGEIFFKGNNINKINKEKRKDILLDIQMVFQDPFSSLNPRKKIFEIVGEAPLHHGLIEKNELRDYVSELLWSCGIDPSAMSRYPHQFSGGQRQRIAIARALAVKPDLLICDEIVSALDVSIQAQILNLIVDLKKKFGITVIFISHDLSVVRYISDSLIIMYLGKIVEEGKSETIFKDPKHPYTKVLMSNLPDLSKRDIDYGALQSEISFDIPPKDACSYYPRCNISTDKCLLSAPKLIRLNDKQLVSCINLRS
tara:strand:- start:149 stop:1144 length:996 start_codon:yes stop_codon:yes gene_type:complete